MQKVIAVLWPSFIIAGLATVLCFATLDPFDLAEASGYPELSRIAIYSIAFLGFWVFTALSSLLTVLFSRPLPRIKDGLNERAP